MLTPEQFTDIKEEAYRNGIPHGFEFAILREYLQCEFLSIMAALPGSEKMGFIGGTALRLLYDLDRFSEDLDFDNCGLLPMGPGKLFVRVCEELQRCGYAVEFRPKIKKPEQGGNLVFKDILFRLGLSPHQDETLKIKLEYTTPKIAPATETVLLSRFGFVAQVMTESLPVLCARKLLALVGRKRIQPRDFYDLVWFFSRRIKPDLATLKNLGLPSYAAAQEQVLARYHHATPKIKEYERDLLPLLLRADNVKRIYALPELTKKILA